jgi:small subunit ribosomal protein S16
MAVHIRLQRHGTTNKPFYHVVATDSRSARNGRFLEKLGIYDPKSEPSMVKLDGERIQYWYGRGAQLSPTVEKLVKVEKLTLARVSTAKPLTAKKAAAKPAAKPAAKKSAK